MNYYISAIRIGLLHHIHTCSSLSRCRAGLGRGSANRDIHRGHHIRNRRYFRKFPRCDGSNTGLDVSINTYAIVSMYVMVLCHAQSYHDLACFVCMYVFLLLYVFMYVCMYDSKFAV